MMKNPIIIGTLGGIASALLFLGAAKGSTLALPLLVLSPLPVLIVGLGWLPLAGVLSALALLITLSVTTEPLVAIVAVLIIAVPGLASAYWYTLSRPASEIGGQEGQIIWFPLDATLGRGLVIFALSFTAVGLLTGFREEEFEILMREFLREITTAAQLDPANRDLLTSLPKNALEDLASRITRWLPLTIAATWVAILALSFYLAERLSRVSGRLQRPQPDFAANISLHPYYIGIFVVGVLIFAPNSAFSSFGAVIAGTFGMGLVLIGLATLHFITRTMPARPLILLAVYGPTLIFGFPAILILALGIVEIFLNLRRKSQT